MQKGRLICADCGESFGSKVWHSTDKYRRTIWQCNAKFHREHKCATPHLTEDEIKAAFVKALNKLITSKDGIMEDLKAIRAMLLDTSDLESQLAEANVELEVARNLATSCFRGKAITEEDVSSGRFELYQARYLKAREIVEGLESQITDRRNRSRKMARFISELGKMDGPMFEFSEHMFTGLADHITVYSKKRLMVAFKCGTEIEVSLKE